MKHEPTAVVCPVTRRPIDPAREGARQPPPRKVIPPSPGIPRGASAMGLPPADGVTPRPDGVTPRPDGVTPRPDSGTPRVEAALPPPPRLQTPSMGIPAVGSIPAAVGIPRTLASRSARSAEPPARGPDDPHRARLDTMGLLGRVVGDRYAVNGVIGEGAMGIVYEAEHLAIGKLVAVKVLHPRHAQDREAISRLRHEARVAGTLGHPNICAIYDMGRLDDGSPYLVMERLHGETLAERLDRDKRLSVSDMQDITLQILSALAAAHQRGVVHRDLKPENIFLSKRDGMRPVPKLLDFGISKADDIDDTHADPAGAALAAGTPFYMAPEQAQGGHFDYRVDLWSVGVVLYEGLTGQRPFMARNYNALLVQILNKAPPSIREIDPKLPAGLGRVLDRALAKRAEDRFQSAMEFQNALRSHKDEEPAPKPLPLVINEQTTDDGDSTFVFSRIDMLHVAADASPAGQASEEDLTPVYAPSRDTPVDEERTTMVEAPKFLSDDETLVRQDDPGSRRKR